MDNLIFVGSEAEGYYGGAYDCFGVFVSKEQFNKHESEFKSAFSYRSHGELDGKHSDVEGDLLIVEIEGILDVMKLINEKQPDYDIYHFTEYAEEDEELNDELTNHLIELKDKIDNASKEFETVTFILTENEHAAIKEFIEDLRKSKTGGIT